MINNTSKIERMECILKLIPLFISILVMFLTINQKKCHNLEDLL